MATVKSKGKVIWALDPFAKNKEMIHRTAESLKSLCELEKFTVEPVYVLSPDGFNWTGDFSGSWVQKFEPMVKDAVAKILTGTKLQTLPLKILVNKDLSLRKDVKKLLDYSKKVKARYLVVNTSAREGLSRMLLGSFAETILLHSRVPVLLFNPEAKAFKKINRIVFPTDLSNESKKAFKAVIEHAKAWGAEIHIFHKLPDPIEPMVQTGVQMAGGGWVSVYQFLERESKERQASCELWSAEAAKKGVKARVYIEEKPGFVTDALCDYVKAEDADMVMLSSKAGVLSSVLVGSVARQMARHSSVPVLIQHYSSK